MTFFAKFLHKNKPAVSGSGPDPATLKGPAVRVAVPEPSAAGITAENVRLWCSRLQREADRTGNARLAMQASNIRARFGITS